MQVLSNALNTALGALQATQVGLAVASNNISNAQTPGYSRQQLTMLPLANSGGVAAGDTQAIRDRLIDLRLRQETSGRARDEVTHQGLSDIEMLFNESANTGMLPALTDFFNSFQALSAAPTSLNLRQEVTANAGKLTSLLNSRAASLSDIQSKTNGAISDDVAQANTLIDQIASLSKQISEEGAQPANELRDQRSVLVQQLSEIVDVHELDSPGNYQLTVGANRPVVYNGSATHLETANDSNGFTAIHLGVDDITSEISGGRISARLDLRDKKIPQYLGSLDQLAYELVQNVNSIHSSAYDLNGNTGNNFFKPLTSADGAAQAIALDAGVSIDPRKIATSSESNGMGNEAAIALGNLMNAQVFSGGSVIDQYRGLVYSIGSDTANADLATQQHDALLNQLQNRRQETSGVSIDEETVKILQFQKSFEASARVVKAVDDLLQMTLTMWQ